MKTILKKKLDNLDVYLNKGNTIVLGEEYFFSGKFYKTEDGGLQLDNCLNNELSEAVKYLSKKGINIEIISGPPLRYIFVKS